MSTIVSTKFSTYEVEFNVGTRPRVRRISGDSGTDRDNVWVEADAITHVDGCLYFLWNAETGRGAMSAPIVSEEEK